jgi:hypothetical protein
MSPVAPGRDSDTVVIIQSGDYNRFRGRGVIYTWESAPNKHYWYKDVITTVVAAFPTRQ